VVRFSAFAKSALIALSTLYCAIATRAISGSTSGSRPVMSGPDHSAERCLSHRPAQALSDAVLVALQLR